MVLFGQRLYNKTHDYVDLIEDISVFFSMFIPEHGKESNSPSYERRVSLMAFLGIGMKPISPFFGE